MKKAWASLLAAAMVGAAVLAGCGGGKSVEKVDGDTAAITELEAPPQETPGESADPPAEATEPPTETIEPPADGGVEAAKPDFLAKNGLAITPQGEQMLVLTTRGSDEVEEMKTKIAITTVDAEEAGYVDTTAVFEITVNSSLSWWTTAFDRYTGTCFESSLQLFTESGTTHESVCVIDVDGKQYDCGITLDYVDGPLTTLTVTVRHPKEYDGVVFQLGKFTPAQREESRAIDYTQAFTVDQYPLLLEGQYFFTETDQ